MSPITRQPLDAMSVRYVVKHMRDYDRAEIFATRWDDNEDSLVADTLAAGPMSWVLGRERPIACWGAQELWPGMWTVWMFATDEFKQVASALTKFVLCQEIPQLVDRGIQRAECKSMAGHDVAHRWLERLGAVREATHENYGRGRETFYTYAWNF